MNLFSAFPLSDIFKIIYFLNIFLPPLLQPELLLIFSILCLFSLTCCISVGHGWTNYGLQKPLANNFTFSSLLIVVISKKKRITFNQIIENDFLKNHYVFGTKMEIWTIIQSETFFRDHHSAASKQIPLPNAAIEQKNLPTPALGNCTLQKKWKLPNFLG